MEADELLRYLVVYFYKEACANFLNRNAAGLRRVLRSYPTWQNVLLAGWCELLIDIGVSDVDSW